MRAIFGILLIPAPDCVAPQGQIALVYTMKTSIPWAGIVSLCAALAPDHAYADPQTNLATVTEAFGTVEVLRKPSSNPTGDGPHLSYKGTYYVYGIAAVGSKLENGEIIRTRDKSTARLVYPNGDSLSVGESSSFRIMWQASAPVARTEIDVEYGKLRGLIKKGGPRSRLFVRTRTAVMGVRGTDWVLEDSGTLDQGSRFMVLNGEVAVNTLAEPERSLPVKAGEIATVFQPENKAAQTKPKAQSKLFVHVQKAARLDYQRVRNTNLLQLPKVSDTQANAETQNLNALATQILESEYKRSPSAENWDVQIAQLERAAPATREILEKQSDVDLGAQVEKAFQGSPNQ